MTVGSWKTNYIFDFFLGNSYFAQMAPNGLFSGLNLVLLLFCTTQFQSFLENCSLEFSEILVQVRKLHGESQSCLSIWDLLLVFSKVRHLSSLYTFSTIWIISRKVKVGVFGNFARKEEIIFTVSIHFINFGAYIFVAQILTFKAVS